MITRITKENRAKYVRLFAKATEALKASNSANYPADFSISSLEEYFQNIEQLFDLDPQYIRLPLDEETFDIDLNTRQITIPASFKKAGLGVQGDDLAETVYFRTDRFFDMTDLNETFIVIQWEAPNGKKMASPAYFQEVDSETDKLIFGWAVTKSMTAMPGTLKFSVAFIDGEVVNTEGDELDVQGLDYRLGTLTSTINISTGLNIASNGKISFEDRLVALKNRIKNTPILGGIVEGLAALAEILEYNGFKWDQEKVFGNIFEDLVDDPTKEGEETGLTMLAVSPNAGIISYEFYKEGQEDPIAQGPGAIRYIPVTYPESEKRAEGIYFIKEGENDFRYFDEGIDSWMIPVDEQGTEVINPLLHEKIAFLPVEGPGTYYAKVTNKEGKKVSVLDTRNYNGLVGVAIIPAPTEINAVVISSETDIFTEENPVVLNSAVEFATAEDETVYQNLEYQWCKRMVGENGEVVDAPIEGAKSATHEAVEIGDYVLTVINHWNKADSAPVTSGNVIRVYLAALKPEIVSFKPETVFGLDVSHQADIAAIGTKLMVDYTLIEQEQAVQYVHWMVSDSDDDASEADWKLIMKKDEEGNETEEPVEGLEFIPEVEGDYKAVVYNFITETNQQSTSTDEGLVEGEAWSGKIIRVVSVE